MRLYHFVPLLALPALLAGGAEEPVAVSFLPAVEQAALMACSSCLDNGSNHKFNWQGLDYVKCEDVGCHTDNRTGTCRGEHQDDGCVSLAMLDELEKDVARLDRTALAVLVSSDATLRYSTASGHIEVTDCEGLVVAYLPVTGEGPAQLASGL